MSNKLITCKACGAEMAANAKACPKCGAKNKKPFYTKWWFYIIIVVVAIAAIGSAGDSDSSGQSVGTDAPTSSAATAPKEPDPVSEPEPEPEPVSYTPCDVTELFSALDDNALRAERTYQDQYMELYGYLDTIDSDGSYITIGAGPENWDYMFQSVQCFITDDSQLDQVMEMSKGDTIMVRGKITDIGEILGFLMDIGSIN